MEFLRRNLASICLLLVLLTGACSSAARAQDEDSLSSGWKLKSRMGLQVQQSQFSSSWQGDEVGTVAWAWTWNSEAENQLTPWANWLNTLVTQFGQTHQQNEDRSAWDKPRKSADKITYRGLLRFTTRTWAEPFVAFDIDTQFYSELDSLGVMQTAVFSPAVLRPSLGASRTVIETDTRRLITRLGIAAKTTIDRLHFDDSRLEVSTRTATEGGFEWFTTGRWVTPKETTTYESELRFFKAFATTADHDAERDHWAQIDIDWQNNLSTRVTSYIEFVLFWQILYEAQQDLRGQFKQTLGVGLTWELL